MSPLSPAVEHADLPLLRRMADAVSRVVRESPPEGFGRELRIGADGTPTKHVDEIAEKEILRLLRDEQPGIDLLSEEAGFVDFGGDRVLVADPIDGTTNAARGIPFYCISLAVGRKTLSDVECGLVLNLCTGQRYEAVRGQGATLDGRAIRARSQAKTNVYSVGTPRLAPPLSGVVRGLGASALEMSLVAQGALDGYTQGRPILRIIDIAAATLLVREAGGVVLTPEGEDLDLPLSLEPRFNLYAAADRAAARLMGAEA